MIDKHQIEAVLSANGLDLGAPDEEIKSILISARYNVDEVEAAVVVLRRDLITNKTRVDGLNKVFRTNDSLDSREISQLLGIEVDIETTLSQRERNRKFSTFQLVLIVILSTLVSVSGIIYYMFLTRVGLFHPSVGSAFLL